MKKKTARRLWTAATAGAFRLAGLLLLSLLLLAGCQAAQVGETGADTTGAPTRQTAETVETEGRLAAAEATATETAATETTVTETTETEAAEPSLPWELPEQSPDPSYTDYFAEERIYDLRRDLHSSTGMNLITDPEDPWYWTGVYSLEQDEESLRVVPYKIFQETWVVGPAENYRDCLWAVAMPDRAYGFRGGREVVSVDYLSGEITTLYRDETGALSELIEEEDNNTCRGLMILAEGRVLYFLAGCEDAAGIYRLYLPEGQLDLIHGGIPLDTKPWLMPPLVPSNRKVGWCEENPQYAALKEELNTPDSAYLARYYAGLGPGQEPDRATIYEILDEAIRLDYGLEAFQLYQYDVETETVSGVEPEAISPKG